MHTLDFIIVYEIICKNDIWLHYQILKCNCLSSQQNNINNIYNLYLACDNKLLIFNEF